LQKTISLFKILSSKVALKAPSGAPYFTAFLIEPLIPDTVLIYAPVNLDASRLELNIPFINAVFFIILYGSPINFNFFITLN
jgi:hypothetical protein